MTFLGPHQAIDLDTNDPMKTEKLSGKFEFINQVYSGQRKKKWEIFQNILGPSGNIHFRKPALGETMIINHYFICKCFLV